MASRPTRTPLTSRGSADIAGDGAPRQQGRVLERDAEPVRGAQRRRGLTVDGYPPGGRPVEIGQYAQHRRLPAARGPEERGERPGWTG